MVSGEWVGPVSKECAIGELVEELASGIHETGADIKEADLAISLMSSSCSLADSDTMQNLCAPLPGLRESGAEAQDSIPSLDLGGSAASGAGLVLDGVSRSVVLAAARISRAVGAVRNDYLDAAVWSPLLSAAAITGLRGTSRSEQAGLDDKFLCHAIL